jgi:superoxide dismutase|tara:strand:- start:1059 stop:1232 length:174 start_codon:yes stop_codon:yes gene_type:complete
MEIEKRLKSLRDALEEIRNVARISEGTGWYFLIADNALKKDESSLRNLLRIPPGSKK